MAAAASRAIDNSSSGSAACVAAKLLQGVWHDQLLYQLCHGCPDAAVLACSKDEFCQELQQPGAMSSDSLHWASTPAAGNSQVFKHKDNEPSRLAYYQCVNDTEGASLGLGLCPDSSHTPSEQNHSMFHAA